MDGWFVNVLSRRFSMLYLFLYFWYFAIYFLQSAICFPQSTGALQRWCFNPRGDHWAEFGPRDQCRLCARPKFGPTWYDVVEQFSFPSLVTDPGKTGVIGKLIHSSSCANFNQVQMQYHPMRIRVIKHVEKSCPYLAKFTSRVVTNLHFRSWILTQERMVLVKSCYFLLFG